MKEAVTKVIDKLTQEDFHGGFQKLLYNKCIAAGGDYFKGTRVSCVYYQLVPDIGLAVRVFANDPGDLGSIAGRVIPKTQKMVLDASLLNTQHYKVWIKGKVEQSREGVAPSPIEKGAFGLPLTMVANFTFTYYQ